MEQLEEGDFFYLHVLNETLTYEVDQILVVKPYQIDALKIDTEQDYVTLVTCTPYGVNSHRLLVRGHRTEFSENGSSDATDGIALETEIKPSTWEAKYWEGIRNGLFIFLLIITLWLVLTLLTKKLRKRKRP